MRRPHATPPAFDKGCSFETFEHFPKNCWSRFRGADFFSLGWETERSGSLSQCSSFRATHPNLPTYIESPHLEAMKFLLVLVSIASIVNIGYCVCPNSCSGHGTCGAFDQVSRGTVQPLHRFPVLSLPISTSLFLTFSQPLPSRPLLHGLLPPSSIPIFTTL